MIKIIIIFDRMSKGKAQKVELEEEKGAKIGFENSPKLFSKWSYDDIKVPASTPRSKTLASSTTSQPSQPKLKFSFPTPPDATNQRSSERLFAPSLNVSSAPCSSTDATLVRRSRLSALSDTLSR